MKKIFLIIVLSLAFTTVFSQVNQFDANNKRHGKWIKKFKNGNIRYQGNFDHGKEIGVFKFYSLASPKQPLIIKTFNTENNIAHAQFFDTAYKRLISEGDMQGKNRIGKWLYYHNDGITVMQEENYINGVLDGKYTTFFKNKKPTIETNYKNGKLHGSYKRYSIQGVVYQDLHYKNGKLDGLAIYHNRLTGQIIKKGKYLNDNKVGVWEFYFEGELSSTKNYSPKKK